MLTAPRRELIKIYRTLENKEFIAMCPLYFIRFHTCLRFPSTYHKGKGKAMEKQEAKT